MRNPRLDSQKCMLISIQLYVKIEFIPLKLTFVFFIDVYLNLLQSVLLIFKTVDEDISSSRKRKREKRKRRKHKKKKQEKKIM